MLLIKQLFTEGFDHGHVDNELSELLFGLGYS